MHSVQIIGAEIVQKKGAQMAQKKRVQNIVLKKKTPQQFYTPGTAAIHKLALVRDRDA